jgi:hypothetical protein
VTGTYNPVGTYKPISAGKNMSGWTFDETGFALSSGFANHTTWRGLGVNRVVDGEIRGNGSCVGADPSGDQISLISSSTAVARMRSLPLFATVM